ncbi:MAG: hypothetical protein ACRDQD_15420 [Nocardioidaceae bacterium]
MSKKKSDKHKKRPQRKPTKHLRAVESRPDEDSQYSQELMQGLRRALRADHPMHLLASVSQMMTLTDPRTRNPFEADDESSVTLDVLVDSFIDVDYAETTAALTVMRAFSPDELLSARLGKVLKGRRQPMPGWLDELDSLAIDRVVEMRHVLGDGDDYFLDVRFPTGEVMTALVYVDHNLGTVVKDAFVVPEAFDAVQAVFHEKIDDPDTTFHETPGAEARAVITDAIDHGALLYPPLESDTWPACRPLVEWLVRRLPEGGSVPERPEWGDDELAALHEAFFASPYGKALDTADQRGLLEDFTWFNTDWGPGDPLRWSPVNVEMLLVDWIPRKIVAEVAYLAKAPALLRTFIEYCHDRQGIRRELTDEVLAAVDHWEPEYQRLIRSSRPQGAAALAATMLGASGEIDEDSTLAEIMLESLDRAVGSRVTLMKVDAGPLPDESFEWAGVPDDIHQRVKAVLDLCDRCATELFDVEHRTAFRRFLSRAAVGDPAIFRRKGAVERAAAAVCWAVGKANHSVAYTTSGLESQELLAWFGVKGSISQRAEVFLKAVGVDPYHQYGEMALGSPDYLVSARRAAIIHDRERYLAMEE